MSPAAVEYAVETGATIPSRNGYRPFKKLFNYLRVSPLRGQSWRNGSEWASRINRKSLAGMRRDTQ